MQKGLNAFHNAKNPNQGQALKVLCVCSAGLLRSPTAAKLLAEEYGHNTRSCGINPEYALIDLNDILIHWADEIVFMEHWQMQEANERFDLSGKICYVLDIPDKYGYNNVELQKLILARYEIQYGEQD